MSNALGRCASQSLEPAEHSSSPRRTRHSHGQLETIDRSLGLVSKRVEGLDERRSRGLPVLMNPLSTTKVRPETKEEEKNKYVSYIFMLGVREGERCLKIMNHQLHFPKEN